MAILLSDVGGTNARMALARDGRIDAGSIKRFKGDDYPDFDAVVRAYLAGFPGLAPEAVCVAVAGPVAGNRAELTNRDWSFSVEGLAALTGARRVRLINDLTALGYAAPGLGPEGVTLLRPADPHRPRNGQSLVVNAGTGFNVCAVKALAGGALVCLEAESGHTRLPAPVAARLAAELGQHAAVFDSVEEVFAGRGLARLHALRCARPQASAEAVARDATAGDPQATLTMTCLAEVFGLFCRELALQYMPFEGLYFAGSVARALVPWIDVFLRAFLSDPLMEAIPQSVPISVIRDDLAALYGCLAAVA